MLSIPVDNDKIINGTPQKRIINAYNNLKNDFTEDNAKAYSDMYIQQKPSDIISNSRFVFAEPYYGLDNYKSMLVNHPNYNLCADYNDECDKIRAYVNDNEKQMPEEQKEKYQTAINEIEKCCKENSGLVAVANSVNTELTPECVESVKNFILNPNDFTIEESVELLNDLSNSEKAFILYVPFVVNEKTDIIPNVMNIIREKFSNTDVNESVFDHKFITSEIVDESAFRDYAKLIVAGNRLYACETYRDTLNSLPRQCRDFFVTVCESSLEDIIEKHTTIVNNDLAKAETFESAVDDLIFQEYYDSTIKDEIEKFKESNEMLSRVYVEESFNLLMNEYELVDDSDICKGYNIIPEGTEFKEAFNIGNNGKKPQVPESYDLATKIQNKQMDKEAKNYQKRALKEAKGQKIINAAKSIISIPSNIMKKIEGDVRQFDELDDERRKDYMAKPGFRKKWFKNLKLSILYGAAASTSLSLIPVVQVCRHYSKKKDVRIRNELVRELDTNIKVCEEKINDANAEGDKQEKYRLMRIRDQLENERNRVRLNSKYV